MMYDVWFNWCFYAMFSGRCHVSHGCWLHPQWQLLMTRSLGACRKGVSFLILGWPALQTALKAGDCNVVKRKSWFLCKDFFSVFFRCVEMLWRCFWSHGSPVHCCIASSLEELMLHPCQSGAWKCQLAVVPPVPVVLSSCLSSSKTKMFEQCERMWNEVA